MLQDEEEERKQLKPPKPTYESGIPIPNGTLKAVPRQEYFYMYAYIFFPLLCLVFIVNAIFLLSR